MSNQTGSMRGEQHIVNVVKLIPDIETHDADRLSKYFVAIFRSVHSAGSQKFERYSVERDIKPSLQITKLK